MTITINPKNKKESETIKAILKAIEVDFIEETYDKDFVKKILEAKQEIKEGKTVKVALEDLWK